MLLESINFSDNPDNITSTKYDCIWVKLSPARSQPRPLEGMTLQRLDWKLRGALSRELASGRLPAKDYYFRPTGGSIPSLYLAVLPAVEMNAVKLFEHCEGMKLKKVLCFLEEARELVEVQLVFQSHGGRDWPKHLFLGFESVMAAAAGRSAEG